MYDGNDTKAEREYMSFHALWFLLRLASDKNTSVLTSEVTIKRIGK